MVEKGLQPTEHGAAKIDYRVGSVEQLTDIGIGTGDDGVDLVVAGGSIGPLRFHLSYTDTEDEQANLPIGSTIPKPGLN
jgi:hypothetical protein